MSVQQAPRQTLGRKPGWVPVLVTTSLAVAAVVAASLTILRAGVAGLPTTTGPALGAHPTAPDPTGRFLLAVAVIVVATYGLGLLARRVGQPAVVGEIAAGILLGPSLLAALSPHAYQYLFPPVVQSALNQTAQLGLVAFMFLVGWELDLGGVRRNGRAVVLVSYAALALPFLAGLVVALAIYRGYAPPGVGPTPFALFVGLALAITAMPVLARVLADTGLLGTPVGGLALASASVADVVAWTLLAVAVAVAGTSTALPPWLVLTLVVAFAAAMLLVVRPLLARVVERFGRGRADAGTALPLILAGAITAAVVTQLIGIHAIFGAFLFGVVLPRGTVLVEAVTTRVRGFTMAVLLPLYFAVAGIHTSIGSLGHAWLLPFVVFAVAVVSKLVGTGLAARMAGLSWRDAYTVGVLMNCRGLTEIVIATVGLQLGIIDGRVFTILVLVALVTTALTGPLLRLRADPGADRAVPARPVASEG